MSAAAHAQQWSAGPFAGPARWDAWRDVLDTTHLPWALEPRTGTSGFDAELTWRPAGDLSLIACSCQPCAGTRRQAEIRRTEDAHFGLLLVLEGREAVRQGEVSALLGPGDLFLWDSAQPIDFEIRAPLRKITLLLSKDTLGPLVPGGARAAPLRLPSQRPEAALLAGYLESLSDVMPDQAEAAWHRSTAIAQDLLVSAAVAERPPAPMSRGEALRLAVETEIRRHARDPRLTPDWLARRQGVSVRYLHMLFAERPYTLTESIRRERLEGARREVLMPAGPSITEIAFGWGFQSSAHFSRRFKQRFGHAPSALRRERKRAS